MLSKHDENGGCCCCLDPNSISMPIDATLPISLGFVASNNAHPSSQREFPKPIGRISQLWIRIKGLRGSSDIVGLDIFFLAFISGASMNPAISGSCAGFSRIHDFYITFCSVRDEVDVNHNPAATLTSVSIFGHYQRLSLCNNRTLASNDAF